jgi:hypothetical protein
MAAFTIALINPIEPAPVIIEYRALFHGCRVIIFPLAGSDMLNLDMQRKVTFVAVGHPNCLGIHFDA